MPRPSALPSTLKAPKAASSPHHRDRISTGVRSLDRLLDGGFPRGAISEITGAESSGRTGLLFSTLTRATRQGETAVYIDPFDSLDPSFAQQSGIVLERLLWIRCKDAVSDQKLPWALKAADILARSRGLGLIVLDWDSPGFSPLRDRVPFSQWFRLKQLLRGKPAVLLVLARRASTGSAASLVLGLERSRARWRYAPQQNPVWGPSKPPHHSRLLRGISSQVRLLRGNKHGHVTVHCDF